MSYAMKDYFGNSRPAPASKDAACELVGMRVQLMKALSYVHHGAKLVYHLHTDYIESESQRMLGSYLIPNRNWLSDEVEPLFVPGTLCPYMIGKALMKFEWIKPADDESDGYARRFVLSEAGEKALESAKTWWNSLSWFQKAWLYVME